MLIVLLAFLVGCATEIVEIKEQKFVPYMSASEIEKEFDKVQSFQKIQSEQMLGPDYFSRLATTVPDEQFVTKKQIIELHAQIDERSREDFDKGIRSTSGSVDRRSCAAPVVNQCGGTCTSHGITNAMDNLVCNPKQDSSNQDLWAQYKRYSTWDGIAAASKYKICNDEHWPNCKNMKSSCPGERHLKLTSYKYLNNDVQAIKEALDLGHPLVYSGAVTRSWGNCDAVIDPNSPTTGGGHAVAIVGYKDEASVLGGGYLIIQNSWGTNCGDRGFQYLPYHYLMRTDRNMYGFAHEIKAVESKYIDEDPGVDPAPAPIECKKVRDCIRSIKCLWLWNCSCGLWKEVCSE